MKVLEIEGAKPLSGSINIGGAKNSAVALIPACILSNNLTTLTNVPDITDINVLEEILTHLGVKVSRASQSIVIDPSEMKNNLIPDDLSCKLRASYYFMASLLAKYKKVEMYFPGGCQIGSRPIDQTLKIFEAMGAKVVEKDCLFSITAKKLKGCDVTLDMPSVGATVNGIIASTLCEGSVVIHNAAREPEIVDVADMLNKMGAKIEGAGTSTVKITGVKELDGCFHSVMPDRIEAGTYIILGCLVGDYLHINNINPEHIKNLTDKLVECGADIVINEDNIVANKSDNLTGIDVETRGYPGFATDLQQPLVTLLTQATGKSEIEETIYENRYMNVPFLNKMGANIKVEKRHATGLGKTELKGCEVEATDLRAGASLLLAGLKAKGITKIYHADYILRGYEDIIEKLTNIGAKISIYEE